MTKLLLVGWILSLAGAALWTYGFLVTGHPPFIDWQAATPWWIADYLPNVEAEFGMLLVVLGMIPIYWPRKA